MGEKGKKKDKQKDFSENLLSKTVAKQVI